MRRNLAVIAGLTFFSSAGVAAELPGVTESEIILGQTMPYSGPASAFSVAGKVEAAYFNMINAAGGVNGRRIKFLSVDDAYSPAKTVEQTRRLVENDNVLLLFGSLGTATNGAVAKYLNSKKVPQLLIASGAARWQFHDATPWTLAFIPSYRTEGRLMARYVLGAVKDGKAAILYQNDDFGRDFVKGIEEVLAGKFTIAAKLSYDVMEPTVDSQVVSLASSGANVFFNMASPKFAAQAIRKASETGWTPLQFLPSTSVSIASVLRPAGAANAVGVLSLAYAKTTFDPQWNSDPGMIEYLRFMKQWYPEGDLSDTTSVMAYSSAQIIVEILSRCGSDLTRENVLRQATNLREVELPMLLPGITLSSSPSDYSLIKKLQLRKFNGESWETFGPLLGD